MAKAARQWAQKLNDKWETQRKARAEMERREGEERYNEWYQVTKKTGEAQGALGYTTQMDNLIGADPERRPGGSRHGVAPIDCEPGYVEHARPQMDNVGIESFKSFTMDVSKLGAGSFLRSRKLACRAAAAVRGRRGAWVARRRGNAMPPKPRLVLYEYEASPWCRRVREHLCALDLAVEIRPCPRSALVKHLGPPLQQEGHCGAAARWRADARSRGAQMVFPYLIDESAGVALHESDVIVRHLWRKYGEDVIDSDRPGHSYYYALSRSRWGEKQRGAMLPPCSGASAVLDTTTLIAASALRPFPSNGVMLTPAIAPDKNDRFQLEGHEGCPGTKLVREVLCTLQIPYTYVPCGEGSVHKPVVKQSLPRLLLNGETFVGINRLHKEFKYKFWHSNPVRDFYTMWLSEDHHVPMNYRDSTWRAATAEAIAERLLAEFASGPTLSPWGLPPEASGGTVAGSERKRLHDGRSTEAA